MVMLEEPMVNPASWSTRRLSWRHGHATASTVAATMRPDIDSHESESESRGSPPASLTPTDTGKHSPDTGGSETATLDVSLSLFQRAPRILEPNPTRL